MTNSVIRCCLAALLLAGFALPAFADGSPVPWPKKATSPVLQPGVTHSTVLQIAPRNVADGNPVPWPKKITVTPMPVADGNPVPWPKKAGDVLLVADGNPVPWPKK
jgi:hypothetical protein